MEIASGYIHGVPIYAHKKVPQEFTDNVIKQAKRTIPEDLPHLSFGPQVKRGYYEINPPSTLYPRRRPGFMINTFIYHAPWKERNEAYLTEEMRRGLFYNLASRLVSDFPRNHPVLLNADPEALNDQPEYEHYPHTYALADILQNIHNNYPTFDHYSKLISYLNTVPKALQEIEYPHDLVNNVGIPVNQNEFIRHLTPIINRYAKEI